MFYDTMPHFQMYEDSITVLQEEKEAKSTHHQTYLYFSSINFGSLFGCFGHEDVQKGFRAVISVWHTSDMRVRWKRRIEMQWVQQQGNDSATILHLTHAHTHTHTLGAHSTACCHVSVFLCADIPNEHLLVALAQRENTEGEMQMGKKKQENREGGKNEQEKFTHHS